MSTKFFFSEMFLGPKLSQRHNKYCYFIYYFTMYVQLCWHDANDTARLYRSDCIVPIVSFRLYRSDCIVVDTICLFGGFHKKKGQFNDSSLFWCRLFTHFVIRVWFCCLQVNCAKFFRLLAHPATPGSRLCCQKRKNLM